MPTRNLTILGHGFNLPLLLRHPGQPSLLFYVVLCCQLRAISDASDRACACTCICKRVPQTQYDGDTSLGCSLWGFYLFVPILDTTINMFPAQSTVHYTRATGERVIAQAVGSSPSTSASGGRCAVAHTIWDGTPVRAPPPPRGGAATTTMGEGLVGAGRRAGAHSALGEPATGPWEGRGRGHLTPGAQSFRCAATPGMAGRRGGGGAANP